MPPELRIAQLRRQRTVLTVQQGAATEDRQNSQKRGAAEKQRSAGLSRVQAWLETAGILWPEEMI